MFFASLKEKAGLEREELELEEESSITDLLEALKEAHPVLKGDVKFLIAVNGIRSKSEQKLREGDVVALLPPVSGG
jgi:molybdopterin synthase sulfur carrier subunit